MIKNYVKLDAKERIREDRDEDYYYYDKIMKLWIK